MNPPSENRQLIFKDFVPTRLSSAGVFRNAKYESLDQVLQRLNAWIAEEEPRLHNLETVVLPNIHTRNEEGSTDTELSDASTLSTWHQFFRVWYWV